MMIKFVYRHNYENSQKNAHEAPHLLLLGLAEEALRPRQIREFCAVPIQLEAQRACHLDLASAAS